MSDPVQDKRAELSAMATGGTAGVEAYKTGQQRVVSDQQAAIDAALSAAGRRGASGEAMAALDSIIRPVGDAAQGRILAGGDRAGTSVAARSQNLAGFKGASGRAEGLAHDFAKNIALEEAAERARLEAERKAKEDKVFSELDKWRQEALAYGVGEQYQQDAITQADAVAKGKTKDELRQIGVKAFANITNERERDNAMVQLMTAETPEEARKIIERYAPNADGGLLSSITNAGRVAAAPLTGYVTPKSNPRAMDKIAYDQILQGRAGRPSLDELYESVLPLLRAPVRAAEASPWEFQRQAYVDLGGDPYTAAGLFKPEYDMVREQDDLAEYERYITSGMTPDAYDQYLDGEADAADARAGEFKMEVAAAAGTNPGILDKVAKDYGASPEAVYAELEEGTAGHEVVVNVLAEGKDRLASVGLAGDADAVISQAATTARENAIARGVDPITAEMLAVVVVESLELYASTYLGGG